MPPSPKDTVTRVHFREGVNVSAGMMVNSMDQDADKVEMELHPAGVQIVGKNNKGATYRVIVPYAMLKCVTLG